MTDTCELQSHCNPRFSPATLDPVKLGSHIRSYKDLEKEWNIHFQKTEDYHEQNKQHWKNLLLRAHHEPNTESENIYNAMKDKLNTDEYLENNIPPTLRLKDQHGNYIPSQFIVWKECKTLSEKGFCRYKNGITSGNKGALSATNVEKGYNYDDKPCITPCQLKGYTSGLCGKWKCCDVRVDKVSSSGKPIGKKADEKTRYKLRNDIIMQEAFIKSLESRDPVPDITDEYETLKLLLDKYDDAMGKTTKTLYCECCGNYESKTFGFNLIELQRQISVIMCELKKNQLNTLDALESLSEKELKKRVENMGLQLSEYKESVNAIQPILFNPVSQRPFSLSELEELSKLFTKTMNDFNEGLLSWSINFTADKASTAATIASASSFILPWVGAGAAAASAGAAAPILAWIAACFAIIKSGNKLVSMYKTDYNNTTVDEYITTAFDGIVWFAMGTLAMKETYGMDPGKMLEAINPKNSSNMVYKFLINSSYNAGFPSMSSGWMKSSKVANHINKLNDKGLMSYILTSNGALNYQVKRLSETGKLRTNLSKFGFNLELNNLIIQAEFARTIQIQLDFSDKNIKTGQAQQNKMIQLTQECNITDKSLQQDVLMADDMSDLDEIVDNLTHLQDVPQKIDNKEALKYYDSLVEFGELLKYDFKTQDFGLSSVGGGKFNNYNYIVNPMTSRRCSIKSILGKSILQNYLEIIKM